MRYSLAALLVFACGCSQAAPDAQRDSAVAMTALSDTLIRLGVEDQAGRDSVGVAIARQDTLYLQRITHADSVRSAWLQAHVATHGWPRRSIVGDRAAKAAWLMIQHSPDSNFQAAMLPELTRLASIGEIASADVAMLTDRVAIHRGQPQRYGTQFSLRNDTLVADQIEDLTVLDSLRAAVGLPAMDEYSKMLSELYKLPVQWPPSGR